MSRLQNENNQANDMWKSVMKEKMHELEKRFTSFEIQAIAKVDNGDASKGRAKSTNNDAS